MAPLVVLGAVVMLAVTRSRTAETQLFELDDRCRNSGAAIAFGEDWQVESDELLPIEWRGREAVDGVARRVSPSVIEFEADGAVIRMTNGVRNLACSSWP